MLKEVYIVDAKRTAIGSFNGSLSAIAAHKLGEELIKYLVSNNGINPNDISEVIMGQTLTAGQGQNPARQAAINAGLPNSVSAFTVNKVCGSGLKAVALGTQAILAGDAKIVIAGGQENMSLAPHIINLRTSHKFGDVKMIDSMMHDGLSDAFSSYPMGITAENLAKKYAISRMEQDEFAVESQKKSAVAQNNGRFSDEILPITVKKGKEEVIFDQDEGIRASSSIDLLAKLKPAFDKEGTVTAGNSSTINDGAAAVLLMDKESLNASGLKPIAKIVSYASAGVEPSIMGVGPVEAIKKAIVKANWEIKDLDLIELNEAFAAQAIAVNKELGFDMDKVNVNGGAIALGHPIGASGARVLVTLLHEMKKRKSNKGLASLCIGGGMGIAICVERVN
jgi:acetyl-CoA C-acetyltransferase